MDDCLLDWEFDRVLWRYGALEHTGLAEIHKTNPILQSATMRQIMRDAAQYRLLRREVRLSATESNVRLANV
jgi:hypothetical protein